MKTYSYSTLYDFTEAVFRKMGCPAAEATTAATALLAADLRGIDSHGVARLSGYVRLWQAGRINPTPTLRILHETPSTATMDADAALGLVAAPAAMELAIQKARRAGTGWVAVQNSNHFGIAGYHAMLALEHDMIGIAMTNASALVAPTFSTERMLGTNPIAVAIPAGTQPPFVADFATTTAANGKLEMLQRKEEAAPEGWVQDTSGAPSTDANILKKAGALLPLGSDRTHGSHKGYALGSIVDIWSAVLSGASYGPWVPPFPAYVPMPENMPGKGLGHFIGAMRIDAFRPAAEFKAHMDHWIDRFRKATPVAGEERVLIPGDPEREMAAVRMQDGIPLLPVVEADLKELAAQFGLSL
ncbi:MAG: Ldh family oxidoreductase [Sphingobacteriales bacterium]|nr:MAG: Ldh family oxidoreductase [Sphingobacteriales bacterium]